jgi:hypothetical protein
MLAWPSRVRSVKRENDNNNNNRGRRVTRAAGKLRSQDSLSILHFLSIVKKIAEVQEDRKGGCCQGKEPRNCCVDASRFAGTVVVPYFLRRLLLAHYTCYYTRTLASRRRETAKMINKEGRQIELIAIHNTTIVVRVLTCREKTAVVQPPALTSTVVPVTTDWWYT